MISQQDLTRASLEFHRAELKFCKALDEFETLCEYAALSNEDFSELKRKARYEIELASDKASEARIKGLNLQAQYNYQKLAKDLWISKDRQRK